MSGLSESFKAFNSFAQTVILGVFLAIVVAGGYFAYLMFIDPLLEDRKALAAANDQLAAATGDLKISQAKLESAEQEISKQGETIRLQSEEITTLGKEIDHLKTAMRLLKVDHRLASIKVLKVSVDPETKEVTARVSLQEVDADGNPLDDPREFETKGEKVYVDFWLAKFEDKYIEENDLLRSTTLCMFKSIYGEKEAPADGSRIEKPWVRPAAYAGGSKMTEFEERIWRDFWTIANDQSKSKELGIRANHGQAIYFKAEQGQQYLIELRASDGLSIKPVEQNKPSG
jgi:hypothetical protein